MVNLQLVMASKDERSKLISACHDGIEGSHFGHDKTLSKVYQAHSLVSFPDLFFFSLACHVEKIGGQETGYKTTHSYAMATRLLLVHYRLK